MTIFIRADSPEVSIEITNNNQIIAEKHWQPGRELSVQIHQVIEQLCVSVGIKLKDIKGIVVYEGPGSYTGLRISISVANALGYSLGINVVGASGENWRKSGLDSLKSATEYRPIVPFYGGQVYTTLPKK